MTYPKSSQDRASLKARILEWQTIGPIQIDGKLALES